jgi:antirestriction protein ArdC
MNVKQIVIERIQEELKAGRVPWQSPYLKGKDGQTKCNFISGHSYRGTNELLLAYNPDTYYMTFRQAQEIGAQIKKGAKSEIVTFWKMLETTDTSTGEKKTVPILNYYRVFGVSQVDFTGVEEKYQHYINKRQADIKHNPFINDIEQFLYYTQATIKHERKGIAFYSPTLDYINMPPINTFENSTSYYETLFHELTHWTGYESRNNRLPSVIHKRSEEYSKEELIAELGSCFLSAEFNLKVNYKNSASYIASWSQFLKDNQNALFSASTEASKAVEYLKEITVKNMEAIPAPAETEVTEAPEVIAEPVTEVKPVKKPKSPKKTKPVKEEVKPEPEPVQVPEIKEPVSGQIQAVNKSLNVALLKRYITDSTILLEVSQNEVKYFTHDNTVIIFAVKVDTDKPYVIAVNPIRTNLKKCKGQILFRDNKIITDSIIVNFEPIPEDEKLLIPVKVPDTDYVSGLYSAVKKVIHASATDNIKPVFHSVCFTDNSIVATDSRRLALTEFHLFNSVADIIVDRSVIDIAIKDKLDYINVVTLKEKVDTALIIDIHYVVITNRQDITIISKEVPGQFPNFIQIIPSKKSIVQTVKFNPASLMPFLQFKKGTVIFNGDTLTHKDTGHSIKTPFHSTLEIGVNAEFLKDCLKDKKEVSMSFTGVMSPFMIKDGDLTNIIMPIQLKKKEEQAA